MRARADELVSNPKNRDTLWVKERKKKSVIHLTENEIVNLMKTWGK